MSSLPFGKKRWLPKHAAGFCGVGRRELMPGNQEDDECLHCGELESSKHTVKCKGTGAESTFTFALQKLELSMTAIHTSPHIFQKAILKRLKQWQKHGDQALP
jgi:hypothetical protein